MIRIVTYIVHRCVGVDRRLDVGRIADVIAALAPDIVALQEVDVGRARTGGVDQAHAIAERLGMLARFHAALRVEEEAYGDALLTALPERLVKAGPLPGHPRWPGLEPRGALWVALDIGGVELNVVNTHLGLAPAEQMAQARALMGPDWLGHADRLGPTILLGDLNVGSRSAVCRCLGHRLTDARCVAHAAGPTATFPSAMPVRNLDHVFVSPGVQVKTLHTPRDARTRRASDHLPLVMDFELRAQDAVTA
jgi:endonuclease/exonuclease/phosphatase family metal-dependent hydrolase